MPIEFQYNSENNILNLTVHGKLDSREIVDYFSKILEGKFLRKDFVEIVDLNEVEDLIFRYSDLEKIDKLTTQLNSIGQKATVMCSYNKVSQRISTMMLPLYDRADFEFFRCHSEDEYQEYYKNL